MNDSHIRALDLNLLRVFDALFEERNATRAAHRLGLTQSAVSHALNRLRFTLGDELFVRSPTGMRATPRAAEIGPRIREGLLQLGAALSSGAFVPAETEQRFAVAAGAYSCAILLPQVVAAVRAQAPHAELRVRGAGMGLAEELDAGRADLAIGSFITIPERFESLPLFDERMVWAIPAAAAPAEPLTLERLCTLPHIVIAMAEEGHVVDGAVTDSGLERRVIWDDGGVIRRACVERELKPPPAYHVPDGQTALNFLGQTGMAALLPRRLALAEAERLDLKVFDPPYDSQRVKVVMLWRKQHEAPALVWLRGLIGEAAAALG